MSVDALYQKLAKALDEKATNSVNRALAVRPRAGYTDSQTGHITQASTTDELALQTTESLAAARAYKDAIDTLAEIYRELTEPPAEKGDEETKTKLRRLY